jgi:hypothetical protein
MVTCRAVALAIAAAVIALPAGMALQNAVMHAIASDQAALPQTLSTRANPAEPVCAPARRSLPKLR